MGFRLTISDHKSEMLGATTYLSKDRLAIQQQLRKNKLKVYQKQLLKESRNNQKLLLYTIIIKKEELQTEGEKNRQLNHRPQDIADAENLDEFMERLNRLMEEELIELKMHRN